MVKIAEISPKIFASLRYYQVDSDTGKLSPPLFRILLETENRLLNLSENDDNIPPRDPRNYY